MMTPAVPDRVLMGPGPSCPYPEVTAAISAPLLGHLDPAFLAILDETCDRLRTVFGTSNRLTFPVSGTGSAGMESAFVNFVRPGDAVVIGVNGLFGERMCEVADRLGAEVVRVDAPWGEPLDPASVVRAHPSPSIIACVHAETSTGVTNDVESIGRQKGDALYVVDAVTSLGGGRVAVDEWAIDICYSATQKCLGVPPGLAPLTVSVRARERLVERPPSWYLDLGLLAAYVEGGGTRRYHHTAPISMVMALHAGLGVLLDEGIDAAIARHERCGRRLAEGLQDLGLELVVSEACRLPQLTTVWAPAAESLDATAIRADRIRQELLERFGIEIGGGVGPLAGRAWRIGCMGHSARERNVVLLLAALDDILTREVGGRLPRRGEERWAS